MKNNNIEGKTIGWVQGSQQKRLGSIFENAFSKMIRAIAQRDIVRKGNFVERINGTNKKI